MHELHGAESRKLVALVLCTKIAGGTRRFDGAEDNVSTKIEEYSQTQKESQEVPLEPRLVLNYQHGKNLQRWAFGRVRRDQGQRKTNSNQRRNKQNIHLVDSSTADEERFVLVLN